eukprot:4294941-Pyramimonas_sp.AAC.1
MKRVEERRDETGGRSTVIAGGDIKSQSGVHRMENRDLAVCMHLSAKHAASLGPGAGEVKTTTAQHSGFFAHAVYCQ